MEIKGECLYCDAKIQGSTDYMVGGTGIGRDGRCRPKWLKERPKFNWDWNGVDDVIFLLCPKHRDNGHYREAMMLVQKFRTFKDDAQLEQLRQGIKDKAVEEEFGIEDTDIGSE
jgi:hypothetical protein